MPRRWFHRTDNNLGAIVEAAESAGFLVHRRNDDFADLDVQLAGKTEIWEVKGKAGTFTPKQKKNRERGWKFRTVRTVADVMMARIELLGID